jgi:hypothetical protein
VSSAAAADAGGGSTTGSVTLVQTAFPLQVWDGLRRISDASRLPSDGAAVYAILSEVRTHACALG